MPDDTTRNIGLIPEEQYAPDSIYGAYMDYTARGGSLESLGYGQIPYQYGDHPDRDPLGVESSRYAKDGVQPLTSNMVTGLYLDDGSWVTREQLNNMGDKGKALLQAEEDIRRGYKRGFWDAFTETKWTGFVPFVGTLASIGGSIFNAKQASDFFRKNAKGESTTQEEALAATLFRRENALASEGSWVYTFGSIVRQAPAFCMEFGILGKAGQAVRTAVVNNITKEATAEAAGATARYGVSRAIKTGAEEYAESAVRQWIAADLKANVGRTAAQSVRALAGNPAVRKNTVDTLTELTDGLFKKGINDIPGLTGWAPGLQTKVSNVLAENAFNRVVSRMSPDLAVQRAWRGSVQSIQKAVAEGFIDLGSWGSEAATAITTGHMSAGKAAVDAVTQLTFGAMARGATLYLPKEAVTRTVGAVIDGTNRNTLALEAAAWQNSDDELMEKAETYGAMLDLLEYVSENTGRGFNSMARAIGLKVAPGLMKPAAKVAGLTHLNGATIKRDAAGNATKVIYNGLIETGREAEAGGKLHQFLVKAFGNRALKDNVANDQFKAAEHALAKKGLKEANSEALQKTLSTGTVQAGLSPEVAKAIGSDVRKFTADAIKLANKDGLEGMKYRAFQAYWIADFMTRHNIDAIAAGDWFRQMGYDGVISEMMEERYSDFASELFGLNARKDKGFWDRLGNAVKAAFMFDDSGNWRFDQLVAEAAAFAIPMVARAGTMQAIARLGGPNEFAKFKENVGLFRDGTRQGTLRQVPAGDALAEWRAQKARLNEMAEKAQRRYDDEMEARSIEANGPVTYKVDDEGAIVRTDEAPMTEEDVKVIRREFGEDAVKVDDANRVTVAEAPAVTVAERVERLNTEVDTRAREIASARVPLDENTMKGLQDSVAQLKLAASRVADVKQHFMDSFKNDTDLVTVPVISDEEFMAPAESYNLMLKTKETQQHLRQASTAGQRIVDASPEMFQTMFKMEDRDRVREDAGWFRRASHWVVEHALRLGGTMATGDMSFLSVNPARFAAADIGVPGDVMDRGKEMYRKVFTENLHAMNTARAEAKIEGAEVAPLNQDDIDQCHAKTLADITEPARQLMSTALAVYQTRLFTDREIGDLAMLYAARGDGFEYSDAANRKFVTSRGEETTFDEYLARPGVADKVEAYRKQFSMELFNTLTAGTGTKRTFETNRDGSIRTVSDILTIPKDLPTERQAIVSMLMELPQFKGSATGAGLYRGTVRAREADGSLTIDDHFRDGVTTQRKMLDDVASYLLPAGSSEITAETDLSKIYDRVDEVHPAILATIARELNIPDDGSRSGIARRNRAIAELALMQSVAVDSDVKMFYREATREEHESRLSSPYGVEAPAKFVDNQWVIRINERNAGRKDTVVTAPTLDELQTKLEPYGYMPTEAKVVYTPYQVLQSENPVDMIRVLGLGTDYDRLMGQRTDAKFMDPLVRTTADRNLEFTNEDDADRQRELEYQMAKMHEDRGRPKKPEESASLYLRAGESPSDAAAMKRATELAKNCKECWEQLYLRDPETKEAIGYRAVADDLLHANNVTVPFSGEENRFGIASPGMRGRYSISVRSIASRGLSHNVYIPINHSSAQDYQSAMLDASLYTAFAKNRMNLANVYKSQLYAFLDHVDQVCKDSATSYRDNGNEGLARKIEDFRVRTVHRPEGGFRMSPATFAEFVSAFSLFRTEVPGAWKLSTLGYDAEALCAIASDVREGTAFLGWTAVVDRVLGGTGLEVSALNGEAPKTGLGKYYAIWAPKESKTLKEAVEAAHPGRSFAEFADRATRQAQSTVQSAMETAARQADAAVDVERTAAPAADAGATLNPMAALEIAQNIAVDEKTDAATTLDNIAARMGETVATIRGGEAQEDVTTHETEDSDINFDDLPSMKPVERFFGEADSALPNDTEHRNEPSLLPSEFTAAVQTFANMAAVVNGSNDVNTKMFIDFCRKLVSNPRKADFEMFRNTFNELKQSGKLAIDSSWSISDISDKDEEGIMPDGAEGNNHRSVEILKSKALGNWLAMYSLVSPQTGRDFQPLIEDLRSLIQAAPIVTEDRTPDLEEADDFLNSILNPRGEQSVDNAADRDALWRHRMEWFEEKSGHRKDIARYIRAYMGEEGKPPVNARAALYLSYLMSLDDQKAINTRMSLASLAGSCATAQPVRLTRTGVTDHLIEPRERRGGENNMDAVVGSFSRLTRKSGAELVKIANELESAFKANIADLTQKSLIGVKQTVFSTYAKLLAPVFGFDSPIVSVFLSRPMYGMLHRSSASKTLSDLVTAFGSVSVDDNGKPKYDGLPMAAYELVDTIRRLGTENAKPTPTQVNEAAVEMFRAGSKASRQVTFAATSSQGQSPWMTLFRAYADARPVSVMTAEVNPERTNQPASSLAITMPGVEPALLQFFDRKDENGFAAVVKKWFPKYLDGRTDDEVSARIAVLRQRMIWPTASADYIVAKSISRSAFGSEVLNGCRNAYKGNDRNMVYVPVFSGDHSSSIILQVPLLDKFKAAGLDYDKAAEMVSDWIGLDLLGSDAKRSFATCGEAPGTAMRDFRYDSDGNIMVDDTGAPVQGHAYVAILWNSDPNADNEAMIGTSEIVGYGARRQKEMAKDPQSATLKVHVAATGEDPVYGPMLTLIKSLAVSPTPAGQPHDRGQFLECAPMGFITDFSNSVIKGEEDISSCTTTDFDSIKLSQANSKTVGADNGKGEPTALMKHVFEKLRSALDKGGITQPDGNVKEIGSELSGSALDDLVGDIQWVNLGHTGKKGVFKLSELLSGVKIKEVKRPGKHAHRMFALVFEADRQMAFQVANVSHRANAEFSRTPLNYMTDALALARVENGWNGDVAGHTQLFPGQKTVCNNLQDLITSWGFTGAALSAQATSIDDMLRNDEEWQARIDRGMSERGDIALDLRQRKFAGVARRDNLTIQFNNETVPLVTNAGWIGKDGAAHSHSASKMFNDTLQGARTIAMADRAFMRGNKRVAIANVNNADSTFRHGMYVDSEKLLAKFSDIVEQLKQEDDKRETPVLVEEFRTVVAVLDRVISKIVEEEEKDNTKSHDFSGYRKMLAECLLDHRGNVFADRVRIHRTTRVDDNGERHTGDEKRPYYLDVSYADLFSKATGSDGMMEFDRTAVYRSMHNDATGKDHIYLGGTMMGLPRTPSYNGSMWDQVVRAGLPVTEIVDKDGKQWRCGTDAMVAPDPFTLKILGCDHDGDKTNLYMLKSYANQCTEYADVKDFIEGLDAFIDAHGLLKPNFRHLSAKGKEELAARIDKLVNLGYLEYRKVKETNADGTVTERSVGLVISERGKARISNSFVQGLYDLNRMLPVSDNSNSEVSVYDGYKDIPGSAFRGVKAQPADPDLWKAAIEEALGEPMLDVKTGKIIGKPAVAMAVQDSAAMVSDARAMVVALAGALHSAYASGLGIGLFRNRNISERDWLDFIYHLDGLSNMTFDDIKEQICGRLGIRPGMIDSIIADIIIGNGASSKGLPTTDREFVNAFVSYGKAVNDEKSSRHWMSRASDPADYEFQKMFDNVAPGFFIMDSRSAYRGDVGTQMFGCASVTPFEVTISESPPKGTVAAKLVDAGVNMSTAEYVLFRLVNATGSIKNPLNGFTYWLQNVAKPSEIKSAIENIQEWILVVDQIGQVKKYAKATSYISVDPAANGATNEAQRLADDYNDITKRIFGSEDIRSVGGSAPKKMAQGEYIIKDQVLVNRARRMRAATALMYDDSVGMVVAARGIRAAKTYRSNLHDCIIDYGRTALPTGESIRETLAVASFAAAQHINANDTMLCEANMQSVPWLVAAFNTIPVVEGSSINRDNMYNVLATIGEAVSRARKRARTVGSNASLDVRYGVEAMFDLMARFVTDSETHTGLHIFDFYRELADANSYGYTPKVYGPAANGLSRISPAFDHITEAQRTEAAQLYERVVLNRELDSNRVQFKAASTKWSPKYPLSFTMSVENLKAMKKLLGNVRKQKVGKESANAGYDRDVEKTIDELIAVFGELEARYGKGFKIEPSAMFGQILPVYACMTGRVTDVAGSDAKSLLAVMPDWVYARLDREVARMHNDPLLNRWVDMASALRLAPRQVAVPDVHGEDTVIMVKSMKPRKNVARGIYSAEQTLHELADKVAVAPVDEQPAALSAFMKAAALAAVAREDGSKWDSRKGTPAVDPRFHHTLAVFDGVEGEAFRCVLAGNMGQRKAKPAPAKKPRTENAIVDESAQVRDMADRMSALLSMWDAGRVEYNGGDKFTIFGKLHEGTEGNASILETRVEVEVVDGNGRGGMLTDEQIRAQLAKPAYLQSLSVASGRAVEDLKKMNPEDLFNLARKNEPVALTRSYRPGTTDGKLADIGAWRIDATTVGTLTGRIQIAKGSGNANVIYHEFFHSVMGFMRTLGSIGPSEVKELVKKYGKSEKYGEAWFNEEAAAEDFRKMVEGKLEPKKTPTFFERLKSFLDSLYNLVFGKGPEAYGDDMERNPLAGIVLTGRVPEMQEALQYYNKDGTLKDNLYTRATRETTENDTSIEDFLNDTQVVDETEFDPSDFLMEPEEYPAMKVVHDEAAEPLSRIVPERMARPYNATNTLSLEIGRAIAAGLEVESLDPDTLKSLNRNRKDALRGAQRAVALNAVRQVGSLYGVDVSDTTKVENLLFKAMNELYTKVSPDGTLQDTVYFANGAVKKESMVTPNALASAITTASGVTPSDVMELTIRDVTDILNAKRPDGQAKYGPDDTFRTKVVQPILNTLRAIPMPDPANVRLEFGSEDDGFGQMLSSIRSGLNNPDLDSEGNRLPFELGEPGTSKNPYHDDNIARYADHVNNPDFQAVMHTVLDRLYTLQASMRWYRQIGMVPGRPEDTLAIRGIAPNMRQPLTQGETMAALAVTPEQLEDPLFSATDYYDQPAFIANHPDAWLDSIMRPNFGGTDFREMAQEQRRQIAGFHVRANSLDGIVVRALGLDAMPGQGITELDKDYMSRFAMESGKTVRKDGATAIKFNAYDDRKAKRADGSVITVDANDLRDSDFTYKVWKVMAQGGEYLVTGVDRLTFSVGDSEDPEYYKIENVRKRLDEDQLRKYSDFDRFLNRMYIQLHDDRETPWESVTGKDGLNLYQRVVDTACEAIKSAKRRMSQVSSDGIHMELDPIDFNHDVLSKLHKAGLIQTVQRFQAGHKDPVFTEGALVVNVNEWLDYWKTRSPMRKKLEAGRRDERTLDFGEGSVGRQLMKLFDDVRKFVAAHPYLSDGDGSFFHNLSTPLPWVGGSGYFMYAANRNEQERTLLEKDTESLGEYEKVFADFAGSESLSAPATTAEDGLIRLFRDIFHVNEKDTAAVREAMARGDYADMRLGENATQRDLALAIYDRLCGMAMRQTGDPVVQKLGGQGAIGRMIRSFESQKGENLTAGGIKDDLMYRMTGVLPHNSQLGHAVKHAIDGITNAFAFRATLFNMLTTPDEDGNPTCYARPADNAVEEGGIPDTMWGVAARWWAATNGLQYDITKTGVQNAQDIYDKIAEQTVHGVRTVKGTNGESIRTKFDELKNEEIDPRSVTAFMAKSVNPGEASGIGHYAIGYARHLFQSTRTLGTTAATKFIHRGWAWSKSLSVSFSYFFPIATRFESPIGAVGAIATLAGNTDPDWLRKHADSFAKLQGIFGKGNAWITKDFIGQKDVLEMLDSNDPYLAELYHWAGVLGIQLSDADVNPQEHSRAILRQDLNRVVAYTEKTMGRKAAKNVKEIMTSMLLKGGDRAFTYHLNATKLAVTAQLMAKLQAKAAEDGIAFDPVRDLKRYSAYVNAEVGGIDPLQFAWTHPVMQSRMNALFFSWGWTRGAWEAGGGTALEQLLFGGHDVTPEMRKYYRGRWMRMFGEVMIGAPMVFQATCKFLGLCLIAGLDPDDDDLTEEERERLRRLIKMVHDTPWFTWHNEDKTWLTAYDITPLMAGISARFPKFSKFIAKDHPWIKMVSGILTAGTRNPMWLAGALPTYEGVDERNQTTQGRRYYQHFGKQGWEWLRWFQDARKQAFSKLAMPIQRLSDVVLGRNLSFLDRALPWEKQGDIERILNPSLDGALAHLVKAFIPFSLVSLNDTSEAGALSMAAPISMGTSVSDTREKLMEHIGRWAANDRRGYNFGGRPIRKGQKMSGYLTKNSVAVNHLINEAMANGLSEKDAYKLVNQAVGSLASKLYGRILDAMPDDADGKFDAVRMSKLLREANRLGRFRKTVFKALQKRLVKQHRWETMTPEEKWRMHDILWFGTGDDTAYDSKTLDKINDARYDY